MQEDRLLTIRSLGKNSRAEINVRIYEFGYENLTQQQRKNFVRTLFELNQDKLYKKEN